MANRKTRRRNKLNHKHLGYAVISGNSGKFRPKLTDDQKELVQKIKEETLRVYGRCS